MAIDKAVDSGALDAKLTAIADVIREYLATSEAIPLDDMPAKIAEVYQAGVSAATTTDETGGAA